MQRPVRCLPCGFRVKATPSICRPTHSALLRIAIDHLRPVHRNASGKFDSAFSDGLVECAHRNIERSLEEPRLIAADELPKFNPHPAAAIARRMWRGHEQLDDIAVLTFTMKNKIDVTPRTAKEPEVKTVPRGEGKP